MKKYINNTEWDAPYFIGDITSKIYCFPWCENVQKNKISQYSNLEKRLCILAISLVKLLFHSPTWFLARF